MSNLNPQEIQALLDGKALPADILVGESAVDYLARKFRVMEAENAIYRDQIDGMQLASDNRVDQMTRIFAGYIMDKCNRKILVVDPEELQHRFAHDRVVQSVASGGKIRYQLLPVKAAE